MPADREGLFFLICGGSRELSPLILTLGLRLTLETSAAQHSGARKQSFMLKGHLEANCFQKTTEWQFCFNVLILASSNLLIFPNLLNMGNVNTF